MPPSRLDNIAVRDAVDADLAAINDIAFRSKAYWQYSSELMEQFREELSWKSVQSTATRHLGVAVDTEAGVVVGFYCVEREPGPDIEQGELDALFVDPHYIGLGIGRVLLHEACSVARQWKLTGLFIQSDPNAEQFYLAMGATNIGTRPSGSIATRQLPLLRLDIVSDTTT